MTITKRCGICTEPIKFTWVLCNKCWQEWNVEKIDGVLICEDWIKALIKEEEIFLSNIVRDSKTLSLEEVKGI